MVRVASVVCVLCVVRRVCACVCDCDLVCVGSVLRLCCVCVVPVLCLCCVGVVRVV